MENTEQKTRAFKNVKSFAVIVPERNVMVGANGGRITLQDGVVPASVTEFVAAGILKEVDPMVSLDEIDNTGVVTSKVAGCIEELPGANEKAEGVVIANPNKPKTGAVAQPFYRDLVDTPKEKLIAQYQSDGKPKPGVREALENTEVVMSDKSTGFQLGDLTTDGGVAGEDASTIIAKSRKGFAAEKTTGDIIKEGAAKMEAAINKLPKQAPAPAAIPVDATELMKTWLTRPFIQRKLYVLKCNDATTLDAIAKFEGDTNLLECISDRMTEIDAAKGA